MNSDRNPTESNGPTLASASQGPQAPMAWIGGEQMDQARVRVKRDKVGASKVRRWLIQRITKGNLLAPGQRVTFGQGP